MDLVYYTYHISYKMMNQESVYIYDNTQSDRGVDRIVQVLQACFKRRRPCPHMLRYEELELER